MAKKQLLASLLISILALQACSDSPGKAKLDTPISGTISVAIDESLKPLLDAEINVFEQLYPKAHIQPIYTFENSAIKLLLTDSARLAIISRELTAQEDSIVKKQGFKVRHTTIAYDAIAIVQNKENPSDGYSYNQLKEIMGETAKNNGKATQVVFDNAQSGAVRYITDSLLGGKPLNKNCFAVNSNPEVLKYVETHPNAIGIIGVSWISDRDDTMSLSFLKTVKVARVYTHYVDSPGVQPYQAFIAQKQYPLWRKVIIISKEARAGLGSGFTSFVNNDKGQRIILKAGIVPANAPIRLVQIKPD